MQWAWVASKWVDCMECIIIMHFHWNMGMGEDSIIRVWSRKERMISCHGLLKKDIWTNKFLGLRLHFLEEGEIEGYFELFRLIPERYSENHYVVHYDVGHKQRFWRVISSQCLIHLLKGAILIIYFCLLGFIGILFFVSIYIIPPYIDDKSWSIHAESLVYLWRHFFCFK